MSIWVDTAGYISFSILFQCPGMCGFNAECRVNNHNPTCYCNPPEYVGDPYRGCSPPPPTRIEQTNPCNPSRKLQWPYIPRTKLFLSSLGCHLDLPIESSSFFQRVVEMQNVRKGMELGHVLAYPNTLEIPWVGNEFLRNCGNTTLIYIYFPPQYTECRVECITSDECSQQTACIMNKCADPCPGFCGSQATCTVRNHAPFCSCLRGFVGNAFQGCQRMRKQKLFKSLQHSVWLQIK